MLKEIYEIDKNGFVEELYIGKFEQIKVDEESEEIVETLVSYMNENGEFVEVDKDFITTQKPSLYKAKWNGEEWVEGMSQEEIDEITKPKPQPPTEIELLAQSVSEREIVEIIQGQQISDLEIRLMNGGL